MKKLFFFLLFQLSLSEEIIINLITTNDIHGFIEPQKAYFMNPQYPPNIIGGSAFYEYVQNIKQKSSKNNEGLLILDGGNFFQGTELGVFDKGMTMIEWMNYVGYDAIVPGQYDFIFGIDNLDLLTRKAKFDFLGANIECKICLPEVKPYIIKEVKGINVGILGIINSSIPDYISSSNLSDVTFQKELAALKKWLPKIKSDGADIIIILTSSGVPWDREEVYSTFTEQVLPTISEQKKIESSLNAIQMGYFANNADIIVSGGISKGYDIPWYDPNSHVYILQNYGNGTSFGHVKLKIDTEFKRFIGLDYIIEQKASHTLFEDDFDSSSEAERWISEKISKVNDKNNFEKIDNDLSSKRYFPETWYQMNGGFDHWPIPNINTEKNIEIITWNCEFFPTANDSTINALSEIIDDLDSDIIAFQEIRKAGWFHKLMKNLPRYDYIVSLQSSFMDLAIIYKKENFIFKDHLELFADNDYNFAGRPPLQINLIHKESGIPLNIINLHMKCCDSGLKRRIAASKMLYEYLELNYSNGIENFIILGDWNDDLKDKPGQHCFQNFFDDPKYFFTNLELAQDIEQASYPKEPYYSFLDHILVTEDFISKEQIYKVSTLPIDMYMGGYEFYEAYISDHKPVLLSFRIE